MKKIVVSLIFLFCVTAVQAQEKVIVNPFSYVCDLVTIKFQSMTSKIEATKITTEEGTYRVFTISNREGVGITAVKIK